MEILSRLLAEPKVRVLRSACVTDWDWHEEECEVVDEEDVKHNLAQGQRWMM